MANKKLKGIIWPNIPDDVYILDAGEVGYNDTDTFADATVGKALQSKANIDGSYADLTAGSAEQLISNVRTEDKTPYLFRTSGGSVDIGDREFVNAIVGGTVAWNQLIKNGNFTNTSDWLNNSCTFSASGNVATYTATSDGNRFIYQAMPMVTGHKYFYTGTFKVDTIPSNADVLTVFFGDASYYKSHQIAQTSTWVTFANVFACVAESEKSFRLNARSALTTYNAKDIMFIDLTQMFGSTIADYIYSLETATAGAGVARFRKLFNKPYYAYNAGELKSVSGLVSHDMTGFNQWDEEWEQGAYSPTTGEKTGNNNAIRSKNYIPIVPSTTYYLYDSSWQSGMAFRVFYYDADKNFLYGYDRTTAGTITTPPNAYYMTFRIDMHTGGQLLVGENICINISWDGSRNGEYEPYELHSYPLDTDLTLRGIPKLDANNSLYYDGDVYEADGTVTRKYGIVDLGTLTWTYESAPNQRFQTTLTGGKEGTNTVCTIYDSATFEQVYYHSKDKIIGMGGSGVLAVYDSAYSSASAFKTAMNGVYLVYELATPTTENADPYTTPQIVNDFGTEEYVIADDTFAVPVGHDTDYPINLVAKLEMAPNSPEGNGDYIVRQTNGMNEYVPLAIEDALPAVPSTDGTYNLKVTVADGEATLSWGN